MKKKPTHSDTHAAALTNKHTHTNEIISLSLNAIERKFIGVYILRLCPIQCQKESATNQRDEKM